MTEKVDENEVIEKLNGTHIDDKNEDTKNTSSFAVDPNTLWISGFDEIGNSFMGTADNIPTHIAQDEAMMKLIRLTMDLQISEIPAMLEKLHRIIKKSWKKHKDDYLKFWSLMRIDSRINYIMDVSPTLAYSDTDRYCINNRKKEYSFNGGKTYDRKMLIVPYMNACTLANGPNDLIWLFSEVAEWDLAHKAAEFVQIFRRIYDTKTDQFGRKMIPRGPNRSIPVDGLFLRKEILQYENEKKLKKGDLAVFHNIHGAPVTNITNETRASFGIYIKCNDPERFVLGSDLNGGTPVNGTDYKFNFWDFGAFCLPFENKEAIDSIFFVLLTLAQLLDEFRVEVLGRSGTSLNLMSKAGFDSAKDTCNNCGNNDPAVKKMQCSKCNLAYYCSRDCQVDDWKYGGHKAACKNFNPSCT